MCTHVCMDIYEETYMYNERRRDIFIYPTYGSLKERSNIYNEAEALCLHPGYVRVPVTLKLGRFVGAAWRRGSAGVLFKDRQAAALYSGRARSKQRVAPGASSMGE